MYNSYYKGKNRFKWRCKRCLFLFGFIYVFFFYFSLFQVFCSFVLLGHKYIKMLLLDILYLNVTFTHTTHLNIAAYPKHLLPVSKGHTPHDNRGDYSTHFKAPTTCWLYMQICLVVSSTDLIVTWIYFFRLSGEMCIYTYAPINIQCPNMVCCNLFDFKLLKGL